MFEWIDDFDCEKSTKTFGHSLRAYTMNYLGPLAVPLIAAGITAVGGIISGMAASSGTAGGGTSGKIRENTVSGNAVSNQDFLFDVEAVKAMQDLTTQMNEWSTQDRDFFEDTYQPFQNQLIEANQKLLPGIIKNSGEALKQNLSDLFDSDMLKDAFKEEALRSGERVGEFSQKFADQINKIPTAEQRIGQAISGVEQRFGQAGKELKRQMGAKGLDVSEAGVREMMIGKATAKAGAAQAAGESARKEMLDATATATGVFSAIQQQQTGMLTGQQEFTQKSTELIPQVGGVNEIGSVSQAGAIGAQLTAAESGKQLGTESAKKDATFTQKGIVTPKFFDNETGQVVDAAGNAPVAPVAAVRQAGPELASILRNGDGNPGAGGGNAPGGLDASGGGVGADSSGGGTGAGGGTGSPGGPGDAPGPGGDF